jgi:hypothetical protein
MTSQIANQELSKLINQAYKNGFQQYSDFAHPDKYEYPNINIITFTCTKDIFNGEVIDIWYNYFTGAVLKVDTYSQFNNEAAKFKFA